MLVNHKRVWRMMREDNLLAVRPKAFVTTTDSNHALEIYLNLARRMTLTGIDQPWVADITYIRLRAEFVCLAVILEDSRAEWWVGSWTARWPAVWQRRR
jgi:putative transposase